MSALHPAPICPYCNTPSKLVDGQVIYPKRADLKSLRFWQCSPCQAYVGCHKEGAYVVVNGQKIVSDGTLALGRLADRDLREFKQKAHAAFDPFWVHSPNRTKARHKAYAWLASALKIDPKDCHIGQFDLEQCFAVILACEGRGVFK